MPLNLAHIAKKAYKQSSMKKCSQSSSRSVSSLLHVDLDLDLDLEEKRPNDEKWRRMSIGERIVTSCGALLQQIQGLNFSP
jgi:hypothetical protein